MALNSSRILVRASRLVGSTVSELIKGINNSPIALTVQVVYKKTVQCRTAFP